MKYIKILKAVCRPLHKCSLLFALFISLLVYAQSGLSSDRNYIYTKNCLNEDCSRSTEAVEYFDDLGRSTQTIDIKATPGGKDVVTPYEYDLFGRQVKKYMPVPQAVTQNGAFFSNPKANAQQSYGIDPNFFYSTELERSPSAKVLSSTKPGNDFLGHASEFGYEVNSVADVKKYTVTTSWVNGATDNNLSMSGNYQQGQLLKSTVTDEDGHINTEFSNGRGQVILVRKSTGNSQNSDTYYLYNKYGQLAYVIPPLAHNEPLNQTTLDRLCYQYRYDTKGRMSEKKLPGKGWEYTVYDRQNRPLMTQDANLGGAKQWIFTKYDRYGRITYTGTYISSQDYNGTGRAAEQAQADAAEVQNETRITGGFTAAGINVYYTNDAYPISFTKILSVNYYDTYPQGSPARPSQILGKATIGDDPAQSLNTKTLPTASFVKNLENDNWTKNFIWYDEKARAVGRHSLNHLSGYTRTESLLDFAGVPQQIKIYHKRLVGDAEKVITQSFEYDQHNRLKKQWHQVSGQSQELLSEFYYNELSQLSNKKIGGGLQSIDYRYNIRGALVKLNDPSNSGTGLFAYELKYYTPTGTANGKKTDNVEEVTWKTTSDQVLRKYTYRYDALNRMTSGIYSEPGASVPQNNFYNETVSYDAGGNILTLQRNGKNALNASAQIDNLSYTYTGNRLTSVVDNSGDYAGYPDTSGSIINYDDNGNMTDHIDKGIIEITYNMLDQPDYVKFEKTYVPRFDLGQGKFNVNTRYLYRSDGTKLKKVYTYGSGKTNQETTTETDYLDGFQYEAINTGSKYTAVLKFVPTSEGYYNFENNKYIYNYVDHLGNVRLSYFKNASGSAEVFEENNYYPFGLKHQGYNQTTGNPSYNYQYSGKELQKETGWGDFGARMYMSDIGRWGVIDPLAETSRRFNPYNYAYNNPVMFIDPDGRKAQSFGSEYELFGVENSGIIDRFQREANRFGSFSTFLGNDMPLFYRGAGSEGGGGNGTFGETQFYKDIMSYLAQPETDSGNYFQGINFTQFMDNNENHVDHSAQLSDPIIGKKVLAAKTSLLGRLWAMTEPRTWTENGITYNVDADGKISGVRPYQGDAPFSLGGSGGVNFFRYSSKALKNLISTEKGAQSAKKISDIAAAMKRGDISMFAEPIHTYLYNGKTYILDGHNRIKAAMKANQSLEIIELNMERAIKLYKNKIEEIHKGLH